jgi:hypothetical protein
VYPGAFGGDVGWANDTGVAFDIGGAVIAEPGV